MFGAIEPGRIYIFFGKMGAGKTVNAVQEIRRFHREGKPVWVNFPIIDYPETKDGTHAPIWKSNDPEDILAMRDGLFVIDEAYKVLNARKWDKLSEETFLAFTHCRKLGMTGIIIAQSWKRIDISIREIATKARCFEGARFFGVKYPYVEFDVDEAGDIVKYRDPSLERITQEQGGSRWVNRETYSLYDTNHLFGVIKKEITWESAVIPPPGNPEEPQIIALEESAHAPEGGAGAPRLAHRCFAACRAVLGSFRRSSGPPEGSIDSQK